MWDRHTIESTKGGQVEGVPTAAQPTGSRRVWFYTRHEFAKSHLLLSRPGLVVFCVEVYRGYVHVARLTEIHVFCGAGVFYCNFLQFRSLRSVSEQYRCTQS